MTDEETTNQWYLEGYLSGSHRLWRTSIKTFPFRVGRDPRCQLHLVSERVSQRHAEIVQGLDGKLWLVDSGSRNGTFINTRRLEGQHLIQEGDILHFADQEFRIGILRQLATPAIDQTVGLTLHELRSRLPGGSRELREMLQRGAIQALFQPLVDLAKGGLLGYEVLGRGEIGGELKGPGELFPIAEALELELELSEAFRVRGIEAARQLPRERRIFVNTHPRELTSIPRLLVSLEQARLAQPDLSLVVEVHESAVAGLGALKNLCKGLTALGIGVAFDDFGTGQARLLELAESTPDYLKFDVLWLRQDSDSASRRRSLIETLLGLSRELGIATVAEGVETDDQAAEVKNLGFDYAQGYLFGRPVPVEECE